MLAWYEVLLPAVITALAIRIDGFLIGPYWSFSEIVAGMGGTDAEYWYAGGTRRWAAIRRFAYPLIVGAAMSIIDPKLSISGAVTIGLVTIGFLLWPIVTHGLPLGVAKSDWLLLPLYVGIVLAFGAFTALGHLAIEFGRAQGNGDLGRYATDQAADWIITTIIAIIGTAFFQGAKHRLQEKKHRRDSAGYEHIAEHGDPDFNE
jgi:hypothetical protein